MSLVRTGLTEATPKNMLLEAGTIYKNLKYASGNWTGVVLGATKGGNKFTYAPELLDVEIDGIMVKTKGLTVKQGETAALEVNMVEITTDNVMRAMLGTKGESDVEGYDLIQPKANVADSDYEENIAFVGFRNDNQPIIIILGNAICTGGLEMDNKSKDNTVVKMTFESSADITTAGTGILPVKIYLPAQTPQV